MVGELQEKLANSLFKSALQSENADEFRRIVRSSITSYQTATERYEDTGALSRFRAIRCEAMVRLLSAWISPDLEEKRRLLGEAWKLGKEALRGFRKGGDREYWKTYSRLVIGARLSFQLEWSYQVRESIARECMEFGEGAIEVLKKSESPIELASAYAITANCTQAYTHFLPGPVQVNKDDLEGRARIYWSKATELSERTALLELASTGLDALLSSLWRAGTEEAIATLQKALEYGKKTKDKLIIGEILAWLAYHTFWKANLTEEPDEVTGLANNALELAREARANLASISLAHPRGHYFIEAPESDHYLFLALHETEGKKRLDLLRKALEEAPNFVALARGSGYPSVIVESHRVFARILSLLARVETDPSEKTKLLEASLQQREEVARIREKTHSVESSDGTDLNHLADIESEMASVATNREIRTSLLKQAIVNKELSLRLFLKHLALQAKKGPPAELTVLARWTNEYGDLLRLLWETTNDRGQLEKAATAFWDAAEFYEKFELNSRVAECYSRAARAYDALDEYVKATDAFNLASNNYSMAAQRIPALKSFSQDQAIYMQAWSEIEKARHHHWGGEYMLAKNHYETAASLEESTKQWAFLSPYYFAWARVEEGEGLSGTVANDTALLAFQDASEAFRRFAQDLREPIGGTYERDHREMITSLAKGADLSREYCVARVACEEAMTFDRKGDDYSSSEKFNEAAEILGRVAERAESTLDKKRIGTIRTFVLALGTMTRAEAESSSKLYLEASRLFLRAMEDSPNKRTRMLSQGHSRFCLALEAGTRFVDTKDSKFYTAALEHLESAGNSYLNAGVPHASEYTKASKLFFDAYAYLDKASGEKDHGKQPSLYATAERVLQTSADSYDKAGYPAKKDQVLRLLVNVREKHDLAVSLADVMRTPPAFSTTTLATSAPIFEGAKGEEKFQHAQIQSNLITSKKNIMVGEPFDLRIQLVNAGAGPAQLVKLEHIIPQGLELVETSHSCTVEGADLNLKSKKLDPLKTEELILGFSPRAKGPFELRPRIVYLDEYGNTTTQQLDPLDMMVRERGVEGASVEARIILPSSEFFSGESFEETIEIHSEGEGPAILESVEDVVRQGLSVTRATGGSFTGEGRVELAGVRLAPAQSHRLILTLEATGEGKISLGHSVKFKDDSGSTKREDVPGCDIIVHPFPTQMEFLAKAFAEDYVRKRLSYEQSGWRSLMDLVSSLKIPKSQAYGEVRYGHTFGRPLEALVRSGLVEYRTFRGKGRGGNVLRVRACYERDPVKRLIDKLASGRSEKSVTGISA